MALHVKLRFYRSQTMWCTLVCVAFKCKNIVWQITFIPVLHNNNQEMTSV